MTKKTIGVLLILLIVMIMGIGAISAADTDDTLLGEVSDTDIATASVVLKQDNNDSLLASEASSDVEKINENDNYDEKSNQKLSSSSSNLNKDVLSASNDDLVKASSNSFYYEGTGIWYEDLDDAVDEACDNGGGKIRIWRGTYGSDSDDVKIKISDGVSITIEPYGPDHTVIFDGSKNDKWFFAIADDNAKVTISNITFRNGGAFQGGAIEVDEGELNLNNCIFEGNKAFQNRAGGYGWGGAIYLDDDSCTLEARNCRFINNNAASGGGAVCVEGEGSEARFYNCYFEGNTAVEGNDVHDKDKGAHTFSYCDFIGQGSIECEVNYVDKSVTITPDVEGQDEVNYLALYHYGEFYRGESYTSFDSSKTFDNLDLGSYTVYMMYSDQKRFIYNNASFRIVANDFILDDTQPFESLSAAVAAIPDGGTGVITVSGGTYTESENFNVIINNNKKVTIMPKDGSLEDVIFSANSNVYQKVLEINEDCHITMEDITIIGLLNNALDFKSGSYGIISNCEFENIVNDAKTMHPINMWNSNVVLNDCTFQSNGNILCSYSTLNINDCTFTDNSAGYDGGAIGAGTSNLTVNGSKFIDNAASRYGGAIYAAHLKVYDTEFTGNSAERGGAIYITNGNSIINITSSVFDSNTGNYRNIYSESLTREINLEHNEYDLNLDISKKDGSYGLDYVLDGIFDWGSNLNNNYTVLMGVADNETVFGDLLTIEDNKFKINMGVLSAGTHEFYMSGIDYQRDRLDHFFGGYYYSDLYENEFYLNDEAYAKILIDKAKITLNLAVDNVLIPETPVLNIEANWDNNYTIFVGNKYYQVEVVNGKASMQLTGLDLGNHTVVGMRDADENFDLVMNFTTFTIAKTYSNFLVLSTNVEYDTLNEAVANSNGEDVIYIKKGTYENTGIIISNKTLDIIALEGAIFDAQGADANFIIVNENAAVDIWGITFRGLHNRNTNYGAIVNHGYLSLLSCNFTDNKITKTSFAENGGAAIFSDGYLLDIDDCNFINNAAPLKVGTAAVTSAGYGDVSITDSKFINNTAREGGALHFKNITQFEPAIVSCDFEQNTAVKGSAIYVGNNSRYLSVTSSSFKKNDIKNSLGENTQLEGGVIYVNANTTETVLDIGLSNFENNSNSNVDGGVICLDGSSKAYIESSLFTNNSGKMGSVILIKNPNDKKLTLFVDSCIFINNNATTGAIATSPKVSTFIDECLFANNTGENRHIYSNGFTVIHDSVLDVNDVKLNALSVQYGENSIINGSADFGTNLYVAANLTVAGENVIVDIKNNTFTYDAGILNHGKYSAVLNSIGDSNNNTYLMDGITEIFRVHRNGIEFNVSVDNITYGETLKVVESLPSTATGTIDYQLNGKYYTKDELEALKLDAGKYTLVAIYDHDDFAFTSTTVDFEVYKANPTISVPNVDVKYNDSIVLNIESDVASIYTIEIGDYKNVVFVNGSRTVVIDKTLNPGNYTIKVTSQERVNYISNSTEAMLNVNGNLPVFGLRISNANMDDIGNDNAGEIDSTVDTSNNVQAKPLLAIRYFAIADNEQLSNSPDNNLGEEYEEGKFLFQYDEDDDYTYFDTLEDAVDEAVLYGAGIITVRGGTYPVYSIDIEGEVELTIRAYGDEEVIFDCGGEDYFMLLSYETEVEPMEAPPFFYTYQTEGPTVTLENITVTGGYCTYGGAIDLEAGTLTLTNCNFINNQATQGGAIYIGKSDAENDAMVIAVNTTFTNNYAEDEGGAIYIASDNLDGQTTSASFMLCTFLENYQGEDDKRVRNYFAGGNVDEITYQYCVFNGNGEIYNLTIDKINQAVYVNGTSNDRFDSVVLLYFNQVPLYTFYNNGNPDFNITFEDVMGGNYTLGVMNDHKFNTYIFDVKFEMKVPNFIISEDEVYENLTDAIDAVAENGVIYANVNYYYEDNMEIDISKSFTLKNFRDDGVVFDGSGAKWFFTIAEGCAVVFDGIYFTDGAVKNQATIENYGTLIINNCTFESFETGAIIYNSGLLNILNSTFSLNSVNDAVVWNDADLVIDTVEFSYNIVNISSVVYNNGAAEIISANFTGNYNFGNGGAIYNAKSLSVKDTVFTENEGYNGGAVYNEGTLEVINSTFEDNTANGYGGAIYNGNEANIFNSTFTGSSSEFDGGAIYNNNVMTVDNSTLVGNTATGKGGAIYNNKSAVVTKSIFGINFAEEFANIYNAGDIQFGENIFDFYDVILIVPDGEYRIPTTITGTLDPQFNMEIQAVLPDFVDHKGAQVTISDGVFEYNITDVMPKGVYDVILNEIIYDTYGNIYYGEAISDRLIINKANVYINLTVDDIVLRNTDQAAPVLKISASKDGLIRILFNNKFSEVNIAGGQATLTLDAVGEGNYTVFVVREGDENHNDAVNTTTFKVTEYVGNFIVNSTGGKYDTLGEAIDATSDDDVIYVMEGNYSGADNLGITISGKKLSIISLGDVVFDGKSTIDNFLQVWGSADVTICDVVITGFKTPSGMPLYYYGTLVNYGNLTLDGCAFTDNAAGLGAVIYNRGNLNIVGSGFYNHTLGMGSIINNQPQSNLIINESTFENNTLNNNLISSYSANSVKIISSEFAENNILSDKKSIISAVECTDVVISSAFYNNTQSGNDVIFAQENTNLLVENSIFTGNTMDNIIRSYGNVQNTISGCVFTDNAVNNVVLSQDKNLSILESTFSDNTGLADGALYIASGVNAIVNGSVFTNNKGTGYRNIFSDSPVEVSNSVFDAINIDFTVHDIDYGQNETIEGTIDIGTNLNLPVNLDINSKTYSVNVTDAKFTYNAGILNGGDYKVVLNPQDVNSNTFVFDKITKMFTVSRVDPGLSVSIADITQGEKLKVNTTISKNASANVVYEFDGKIYSKKDLENLTLAPGDYLVVAMYRGDKNFLSANAIANVKVNKVAPNITVNDIAVNYGDEIKINVTVGAADYYTVFLDNRYDESVSLYVENSAIFTFNGLDYEPGSYEITVYVFESDNYAEEYAHATLTVNKAVGFFDLSNDLIIEGENATVNVEVPVNASGNITYRVYDADVELVYNVTQSCLEVLIVPNLSAGRYIVTGTYEGDSYYTNSSRINSCVIFVRELVDLNIAISNITYGENATVTVESNVDGDYLVYVGNESMIVTVVNGTGNVSVPNLSAGSYAANVTVVDGNYAGFNETVFDVAIKSVSATVSVEDIVYGEDAVVLVTGEIDGKYIVEIYGENYTVNVADGKGNTTVDGLAAGNNILVSVTIADGNYSAQNTTTFNVAEKYNTTISLDIVTDENYMVVTVTVNDTATGIVKFEVNGTEEYSLYVDVIDGKAVLEDILETGNYTIIATYLGDERFNTNIIYENFTLRGHIKKDTPITAHADVNGNKVTLTVSVDENATGFVKLAVGGTVANIELENGKGTLTTNLLPNSYYVDVTYLGDDDYNMNNTVLTFTVTEISKENTPISLDIVTDENYVGMAVSVSDAATGIVKFQVSGEEEYVVYSDVIDGKAGLEDILVIGDYNVIATYMGDDRFNTNITSGEFTIRGHIKKDTPITAHADVNGNRVTLTVKVDENATGFVKLTVGGTVTNIEVEDGVATLTTNLLPNSYYVEITYLGDENFNENVTKLTFTVVDAAKENTTISLDVDVVSNENMVAITAEVDSKATGIVKFEVTGAEDYSLYVDVIDGKAVFEDVLKDGNYTVIATYMGDSRFNTNVTLFDFTINRPDINITIPDITQGESSVVDVDLPSDATGNVSVLVDGKEVSNVAVINGSAKLNLPELTAGNHTVEVKYSGDPKYASFSKTSSVNVKMDVPANSTAIKVTLAVGSKSPKFHITLPKDADGYVVVNIKGVDYYASVENGTAIVSVPSLAYGSYSVNVTYSGDDKYNSLMKTTTAKIPKPKLTAKNIKIAYTNPYKYKVRVTINGKAVVKQKVTFKFNGKTYKRLTNSKGYATLTLPKVAPKKAKYTITMTYKDIKLSKKVKVNSIVVAKNIKAKKSAKFLKIKVKLKTVAKKVQKGKKITLKFKGKKYKAKTNKKGVATFKIKKNVFKKLKVGKKYTYQVIYGKNVVKKTIKFKK